VRRCMSHHLHMSASARRTPRHLVEIPCEVITSDGDEPALEWATDMSADGLWLEESSLPLGAQLVVCFRPGIWWRRREVTVFAEVARISRGLRPTDRAPGVGLSFLDLTGPERWALRCWLRPRPEPPPARRALPARTFVPLSDFASRVC
jgi:hypothetical protein